MDRNKLKRPRSATPGKGDKQSVSSPLKKKSKKDKVSIAGIAKSSRFRSDSEPAAAAAGGAAPSKNAGGTGKTTLKLKKGSGSTTATADGQIMAQMLSTFSKQEESRFEAFQRSSFQADAVEEFVAACICHRRRAIPPRGAGGASAGALAMSSVPQNQQRPSPSSSTSKHRLRSLERQGPRLQDLVSAPGPAVAQDVVIVVSTLAKIYAQRLVSAAVQGSNARHARQQAQAQHQDGADGGDDDDLLGDGGFPAVSSPSASSLTTERPVEPQDVLDAYVQRVSAGLDPGFYLQGHDGISTATAVVAASQTAAAPLAAGGGGAAAFSQANHLGGASAALQQHRRLAALVMQEAFDKSNAAKARVRDEEAAEVRQGSDADVSMREPDDGADEKMDAEDPPETETNTTAPS